MKAILVSKWCTNGNVMQYLRAHPNSNRTDLVVGMANGLHHLHSRKPQIIHGDLKPDNVLISDEGAAQLCDFGMSRVMNELSRVAQTTSTPLGYTIRYSSYEVIVEEKKTEFSDVYAFGCTSIQK
ncbi:kinase-like domain-containing protein [Cantharellus anzutake]|uniref:kinase-like domain-containing protein n=1 Tax=Cantharellus anzutake TaxID=1750568 RepID=UPI0019044B90|nr:kinase-like domain-containing protein [Cantharellus anzutake]KAF8340608.1 kinase-like domain-containing protein [Cantharellus anzutake]